MKNIKGLWVGVFLVAGLMVFGARAQGQFAEGFAVNRYDPPERGSDWMVGDSLDLRGDVRGGLGVTGDYTYKPLVLYIKNRDDVALMKHQLFTHFGGTLILWERLRLGVNFPVRMAGKGDYIRVNGTRYDVDNSIMIGDLRLGVDLRVVGDYEDPFTLVIGGRFHLPTGSREGYTSDGKVRIEPRLMIAGGAGVFGYAARAGFMYRQLHGYVDDDPFGNELAFAASIGLRLFDHKFVFGPELMGSTVVQKKSAIFKKHTTSEEVIISAKYRFGDAIAGLGAGPGMLRGLGTPKVRVLATLDWFPQFKKEEPVQAPRDRDGDGIIDEVDACPDEPGVMSDDRSKHGCPAPKDRDRDSILDAQDACPDQAGVASDDPQKNGCPPPKDQDGDGIVDEQDACPNESGEKNDDPQKNGCPPPKDQDGDGIIDTEDACPEQAGNRNNDPKKNGCPVVVVTAEELKVNERIEFETGKAKLRPEADSILNSVLEVLKAHPEITKLSVEGHTDNRGSNKANLSLSRRRAAAVVNWLESHGIDKSRLTSTGFGEEKPIEDNATDTGRQNNRRVEFKIVKE
jgi:OmpA-OmpF porin, OOP family